MKKTITSLCFALLTQLLFATTHTVTISGFTYSPATVNALVGDTISIAASSVHPLVQVDTQTDWNNDTPTPASGWTNKTSTYTFVITATNFYYGCANHMASMGMKGVIMVSSVGIKTNAAVSSDINLFPNPVVNGEFTVKTPATSNGKLFIYDVTGKQLESHSLTASETKVKTSLPAGEYMYVILSNLKEIYRNKFLITK